MPVPMETLERYKRKKCCIQVKAKDLKNTHIFASIYIHINLYASYTKKEQ